MFVPSSLRCTEGRSREVKVHALLELGLVVISGREGREEGREGEGGGGHMVGGPPPPTPRGVAVILTHRHTHNMSAAQRDPHFITQT